MRELKYTVRQERPLPKLLALEVNTASCLNNGIETFEPGLRSEILTKLVLEVRNVVLGLGTDDAGQCSRVKLARMVDLRARVQAIRDANPGIMVGRLLFALNVCISHIFTNILERAADSNPLSTTMCAVSYVHQHQLYFASLARRVEFVMDKNMVFDLHGITQPEELAHSKRM